MSKTHAIRVPKIDGDYFEEESAEQIAQGAHWNSSSRRMSHQGFSE